MRALPSCTVEENDAAGIPGGIRDSETAAIRPEAHALNASFRDYEQLRPLAWLAAAEVKQHHLAVVIVGTADYVSPEQLCSKQIDGRSDLYSLGCVMYQLLSGRLPFAGESSMEQMAQRIIGSPVPIAQAMPSLPPKLVRVLERLLAHRPAGRYANAAEAAQELRGLLRRKGSLPAARRPVAGPPPADALHAPRPPQVRPTPARGVAVPRYHWLRRLIGSAWLGRLTGHN